MLLLGRILIALSCSCLTFASAQETKYPKTITLSYQSLGSSSTSHLATVLYDPTTFKHTLSSWTPPSVDSLKSSSQAPQSSPLIRVLLPDGSATITNLAAFDSSLSQNIDLWISQNGDGSIFSASVSSVSPPPLSEEEARQKKKEERARAKGKPIPSVKPKPKAKNTKKDKEEELPSGPVVKVNLLVAENGPSPVLNTRQAPQVDAEGREVPVEEQQEKTLFQKYWYLLPIILFFLVGPGSGGGEK